MDFIRKNMHIILILACVAVGYLYYDKYSKKTIETTKTPFDGDKNPLV